jgi:hypothetical protein
MTLLRPGHVLLIGATCTGSSKTAIRMLYDERSRDRRISTGDVMIESISGNETCFQLLLQVLILGQCCSRSAV